jgi:hypothetical protein
MTAAEIMPGMPVVCGMDENAQFATVDHMEGTDTIKLRRDASGQHHYIPLSSAKRIVDGKIQVDRAAKDIMASWTTEPARTMARGQ